MPVKNFFIFFSHLTTLSRAKALIYAGFVGISVAYWVFYESVQSGRRYLNSSSATETVKFGTKYGAVASH